MEKDFYIESIEFFSAIKKLTTFEINKLNHSFLDRIPRYLYKYRKSGDLGRKEFYLGKRMIYFASFNSLNDIFEGISPATKERILKMNGEEICKYYKSSIIDILLKRFPSLNPDLSNKVYEIILEECFDTETIFERTKGFVDKKDRKSLKSAISSFTYIFDGIDSKMDQNGDFEKGMRMLMDTNDSAGAFCMCESCQNENLWAL